MENRGLFVFLVSIFVFLFVGGIFAFAAGGKDFILGKDKPSAEIEDNHDDSVLCVSDGDCADEDACTLHYCNVGKCAVTQVVLCYQNDGCCPSGCNIVTDNDCSG